MSTVIPMMPTMPAADPQWVPSSLYRMTAEEYLAMVASGAFKGRRRLHLINGLLVEKMTQNTPHATSFMLCGDELDRVVPPGWQVRPALPVVLPGQASVPEPDHSVVRGGPRDYLGSHPGPGDIALVAEIADSSLADDRKYATTVYGPAGIPVYWIVNLVDRQVEVYAGPHAGGYASCVIFRPGQIIPVEIDGHQVGVIAVDDILP